MSTAARKKQTIDYYDTNAKAYAEYVDGFYSSEQISAFLALMPLNPTVLDVGCGSGRDVYIMDQAGAHATGLDLASGMIEYAQGKYPDLDFVVGDMTQIPFQDQSFDGIWSHGSLFHLETDEDVRKAFQEFVRVLKPSGVLHVLVKQQMDSKKVKVFTDGQHEGARVYRFFTKPELNNFLSEFGFKTIVLESYQENERNPHGRHDVMWLHALAQRISQ